MSYRVTLALTLTVAFILPSLHYNAYAVSSPVKIKVFFVNSVSKQCSDRNVQALGYYEQVTEQYLNLYSIKYSASVPTCIVYKDVNQVPIALRTHELVIVITDIKMSESHLYEEKHAWGYYTPSPDGKHHLIVSNALTPFTQSDSGAWTLSHELSHFVLNYQNKPPLIAKDWVHSIQDQVDYCKARTSWDYHYGSIKQCPAGLYDYISVNGKRVAVMTKYSATKEHLETRTSISLDQLPSYVRKGEQISFTGYLKTFDGKPVTGATVNIKDDHSVLRGNLIGSTQTDSQGKFMLIWKASRVNYIDRLIEPYASFEGNEIRLIAKTDYHIIRLN